MGKSYHTLRERAFQQCFPTSPLADVPQELEVVKSSETSTLCLEGHSNFNAHGFNGSKGDCHLSPHRWWPGSGLELREGLCSVLVTTNCGLILK